MMTLPSNTEFLPIRWEHADKKRYYQIFLSCDLLGDWVVTKSWGGLSTSAGRITHVACSSLDEAKKLIAKIILMRTKRGYIPRGQD
jgi:hypothetical protein